MTREYSDNTTCVSRTDMSYFSWRDGTTTLFPGAAYTSSAYKAFDKSELINNLAQFDGYRTPSNYSGISARLPYRATVGGTRSGREGWGTATYTYSGELALSLIPEHVCSVDEVKSSWQNELRTKILVNIKDEVFDAAMVIAEMQDTVSGLSNNLNRVARTMDAVRKKNPKQFHYLMHGKTFDGRRPTDKFLRESASIYLEWKYGIMPTMYDIAGATEALDINDKGTLFNNPALLVTRAGMSTTSVEDGLLLSQYTENISAQFKIRRQAAARADFSIDAEGLRGLSRYGIGLGTVGTVLFDRTPFSFVLNMALPIADLIKAWTSLSGGVKVRGYCETYFVSYEILPLHRPISYERWVDVAALERKDISFKRFGGATIPMPIPFIRNPIRAGNLATVLALFTQMRKGMKSDPGNRHPDGA